MRHIRVKGEMRADRRFRNGIGTGLNKSGAISNRHGTICGSEPTAEDYDRDGAAHRIKHATAIPQLAHWAADICPACRGAL